VAEGQTLPGPGKQKIGASLPPAEQRGFNIAVSFSLERNRNADFAAKGAAIAKVDEKVAAARTLESDVFYWLGFDIATGIFGDPALGAQGNTATGPGSLKIRDSLSPAGQRGFNASVKFHLGQDAPPSSSPDRRPRTPGEVTSIDNFGKSDKVYVPFGEVTSIDNIGGRNRAYLLAINNVRVEGDARHIMIKFHGPPNQVPFVAIGRAAPFMKNGEWVFGDNLVGGGFVGATTSAADKAKGEYTFSSAASTTNISNGLEPGATYYYNIIIPAGAGRPPYQDNDKFTMLPEAADATLLPIGGGGGGPFTARCPQGQLLAGFELRTGDDVDAIRPLCVTPYGPADVGPREPYANKFGGDGGGIRQLVCPNGIPIVIGMYVYAVGRTEVVDGIHLFCGTAATTQGPSGDQSNVPAAVFDGTGGHPGSGWLAPFSSVESDTQRCPAGLVAVGINGRSGSWLDAVGLMCGAPTLTPGGSGNSENTGTTSSALTTKPPVKPIGRVKLPPTGAPTGPPRPPRPICDVAREARARNSPAAPGLEAKCRADLAIKGATIANLDPVVAAARVVESDALYQQGFDIATGIFGDPALGAQGNTTTGPGSLGIRDSLSAVGQRGFNASVKLHLSRNYKP
jgi:hypothetical protein